MSGMMNSAIDRMKDDIEIGEHKCKTFIQKNNETAFNGNFLEASRDMTIHVNRCGRMSVRSKAGVVFLRYGSNT